MSDSTLVSPQTNIELTAGLVAAYVSNNRVSAGDLPALIAQCHDAITALADRGEPSIAAADLDALRDRPSAAQIRNSIRPDAIVSFIDGRRYKTLKRHLTAHGLHPQSYRERYGLPADYPMVAQEYAERRSALARSIGLGVPSERAA
ncbi:putative transcriptional regulator [Methylobacterium sp. PvP062]|uniref:Transcriptional regulator n=2 Tax=Methylobacterium radiotolerans TaxID=31998 RepID=A0ABV2NFV7_9HYPH|nr:MULTISPECIES: MucR family transcriptional regulator [Methylobacterium]MBN6822181.1 MucR family transcriptional regulator [Methylobacterium organophilum]MCX7334892.1 MucR family transcriptional regulator [Hyphomicrobiales bacterium]GAN49756.1 MucR family transcriptional regulator [Methylobacterium sp. ME121]KIU28494.1 MucR family transcriptional regulator [Methylobacterium radiotolerans]KZC01570.1 Transcriptional regulatory protein ros [Methylobacterium radiotolerans]